MEFVNRQRNNNVTNNASLQLDIYASGFLFCTWLGLRNTQIRQLWHNMLRLRVRRLICFKLTI